MGDERVEAAEAFDGECGDVPVAPELAQQRLRVPQHQVWFIGPGELSVSGEQRATLGVLGGHQSRTAHVCGCIGQLG